MTLKEARIQPPSEKPPVDPDDGVSADHLRLGEKIRELRVAKNMTIEQLARSSDLTTSFISQIERGIASLSLVSLRRICKALDIPMFQMFLDGERAEEHVVRKNRRIALRFPDRKAEYQLLSPTLNAGVQVLEVLLAPGEATSDEAMSHRGEEVAVVLRGSVRVTYGSARYNLESDDAAYIVSTVPHKYQNVGRGNARILMAILNAFSRGRDSNAPRGS